MQLQSLMLKRPLFVMLMLMLVEKRSQLACSGFGIVFLMQLLKTDPSLVTLS